eukprot:655603-Ditylum_brightwellii.AAC.1
MQSQMDNDFKDMQAKWDNFFNNYRTLTAVSNDERQKRHQDLDATIKFNALSADSLFADNNNSSSNIL